MTDRIFILLSTIRSHSPKQLVLYTLQWKWKNCKKQGEHMRWEMMARERREYCDSWCMVACGCLSLRRIFSAKLWWDANIRKSYWIPELSQTHCCYNALLSAICMFAGLSRFSWSPSFISWQVPKQLWKHQNRTA